VTARGLDHEALGNGLGKSFTEPRDSHAVSVARRGAGAGPPVVAYAALDRGGSMKRAEGPLMIAGESADGSARIRGASLGKATSERSSWQKGDRTA
jgi:hypothetical protein